MAQEVNTKKSRQPPWEEGPGRETPSFGTWLRSQRKIREVPLGEIADATKISIRYLEALEQDRFDVLPATVFAKGFLREYAQFVGLDPDEVVNSYITALELPAHEDLDDAARSGRAGRLEGNDSRRNQWLLIGALIVALALIAFLIYWGGTRKGEEALAPKIAAPVLPAAPPRPAEEAPTEAELTVTIDFTEDCWVEAEVDGRRRISELHVQGESLRLEAADEVRLVLGNPGGVHLEVNGVPYEPPLREDQASSEVLIDRAGFPSRSVEQ